MIGGFTVLAAALALACGEGEPDPAERWGELGIQEAEFVFLGDLTEDEQESIRRELQAAQVVFKEHFGAVTSDFTAYLSTDLDLLNERLAEDHGRDARVWFTCGGNCASGSSRRRA